jgi:outer membrane protein insertion porin family
LHCLSGKEETELFFFFCYNVFTSVKLCFLQAYSTLLNPLLRNKDVPLISAPSLRFFTPKVSHFVLMALMMLACAVDLPDVCAQTRVEEAGKLAVDKAIDADATIDPQDERTKPTPIQELSPESVQKAPTAKRYDQGVTISRIEIEGNRLIQDGAIQEAMSLRTGSLYDMNTLRTDLRRIYDMGYFTDHIKAVPTATAGGIVLKVQVEENVPVSGILIKGNSALSDEELQAAFKGQTGLPQNVNQLNKAIETVQQLYSDKGYVLARVSSIQDDPDGTINLDIKEGEIEKISFVGNRKTRDYVLKRMLVTKPGEAYNEKMLGEDLRRVFSSQAFDDVRRVITVSPNDPDKYNLVIEVDEKRTGAISLGGGFDTGTGLFGTVGYSDPNFLGRGQNFNSVFSVGSGVIGRDVSQARAKTYQFDVGWSTPSLFETDNALAVGAFGRDMLSFNVPLGVERRIGSEVTWARPIKGFENLSGSLSLRGESTTVREGSSQATLNSFGITPAQRAGQLQKGTYLTLTPTLAFDTRDNRFDPQSGWFNTVSLGGSYAAAGDVDSYATAVANLRRYFKLNDNVTLALNGQIGSSLLGDIPQFNAFRMGGAYSVRGWQEGGLGTGQGFLIGSAELRAKVPFIDKYKEKVPFLDSLRLAAFVDGGSILKQSDVNTIFNRDGSGYSMGLGLRVNLPGVGPLRLDYAVPLSGGNSQYFRKFNFGVGQKF